MKITQLKALKAQLEDFRNSDTFGMGEMEYIEQIDGVIELIDGAIINIKENN